MMQLDQLRILAAIAESGSLAAAGRSLFISQPTVSHHLAALEQAIDGKLVERGPSGARLTPLGELVVQQTRPILAGLDRVEHDARHHALATLRLGSFPSAVAPFLTPALSELQQRRIAFELLVSSPTEIMARVRQLEFDVAVVTSDPRVTPSLPDGMSSRLILDDPLLVLMPDGHPLAAHRGLSLTDLLNETWMTTTANEDPEQFLLQRAFAEAGMEFRPIIRADPFDVTQNLVLAGLGLTVLPELAVGQAAAGIQARKINDPRFARAIHLVWRDDRSGTDQLIADILENASGRSSEDRVDAERLLGQA